MFVLQVFDPRSQDDINLIATNAMLYNTPETSYYKSAARIQRRAKDIIEEQIVLFGEQDISPETGALAQPLPENLWLPEPIAINHPLGFEEAMKEHRGLETSGLLDYSPTKTTPHKSPSGHSVQPADTLSADHNTPSVKAGQSKEQKPTLARTSSLPTAKRSNLSDEDLSTLQSSKRAKLLTNLELRVADDGVYLPGDLVWAKVQGHPW
jgi:hypothetical protein